jgi:hypothetical protein
VLIGSAAYKTATAGVQMVVTTVPTPWTKGRRTG